MIANAQDGRTAEAAARGIRQPKGSGHSFQTQLEQMEQVERENGGINPNALLPRFRRWLNETFSAKR